MNTKELKDMAEKHLMQNYGERSLALVRGEGARVWDADGKEYLDFGAGIAVCSLGHCHPKVTDAIREQAGTLVHVSNLYLIEPQVRLGKLLTENSFASKVFFCNSGAEANEGAMKLARKYAKDNGHPERFEVLSMEGSFHGRTLATVAATGQTKYHHGFEPMPAGFRHVPWNDPDALERAVTKDTAAILIEPVQGEGGVRVASRKFLEKAREVCDKLDLLLLFDEVQCGVGRTGYLFAHQGFDVEPDVMTLAKALGNGVPIGAILASEKTGGVLTKGTHAATFGGNPLACAAALATMEIILGEDVPAKARETGEYFLGELRSLAESKACIQEVRGMGLMIGVELDREAGPFLGRLAERGIIALTAGTHVLRFVPPLIISREDVDTLLGALREILPG
jgi:acetylornithine aminotransferase/acetylornithine/N-succinyldiaminopimelate aminotransferase